MSQHHTSSPLTSSPASSPVRALVRAGLRAARLGTITAVGALVAAGAGAATLDVCSSGCTYSSIQAAVHAASAGDTVELAPETFHEGGIWINKDLTIRTSSGTATVDGGLSRYTFQVQSSAVVSFESLNLEGGTDCRLDNMGTTFLSRTDVLGGGWSSPSTYGGILNQPGGQLTIQLYSVVAANASTNYGGGITNFGGDVDIDLSTVIGNEGHRGGGLFNAGGTVAVTASSFSFNNATVRGGAWANVSTTGTVAYLGSASYSSNTADVDCDTYWDVVGSPSCVN